MANMTLVKTPMPEQDPKVRARNFKEVTLGYTAEMAIEEAGRCLKCKNPKCVEGCPVNVRIPEFIGKVQEGESRLLTKSSPPPTHCPLLVAVSAPRRPSAKPAASAASRVSPLPSAVWSVSLLTGTVRTSMQCPRRWNPTASRLLSSVPALPA